MRRGLLCLALAACCLLCGGCGRETYTFTLLSQGESTQVERQAGSVVEGECLVYTAQGDVFYARDYRLDQPLTGVLLDPPERMVTDGYTQVAAALDSGQSALLIYIDGLGWDAFQAALADGDVPALSSLTVQQAAAVYPTITPVNYAAMVTGQPPAQTGVTGRGIHQVSCDTLFDYAAGLGLASYASEGDTQILALSNTHLELSPDLNGDGTGDDEIFACALEALPDYPLVFVHFHSVDDASHQYGPTSQQARDALIQVDRWCAQLMEGWGGKVVITADHGQHDQDGTGDPAYADRRGTHGAFAASDLLIPFLTN
jgi:predicted AlkP superfamily pyrophosphatase or phosphodiesterase